MLQNRNSKRPIRDGKELLVIKAQGENHIVCSKECKEFIESDKNKLTLLQTTPWGTFIRENKR